MSIFDPTAHEDDHDEALVAQVDISSLRTGPRPADTPKAATKPTARRTSRRRDPAATPAPSRFRATFTVPAELATAARAERDTLRVTLTDVVMVALGDQIDQAKADKRSANSPRFGSARLHSTRHAPGQTSGLQWGGTTRDLAAIDELVASAGFTSRNELVAAVLRARYRQS